MTSPNVLSAAACAAAALIALTTLTGCSSFIGPDDSGSDSGSSAGGEPVQGGAVDPGKAKERKTIASQDANALETKMHFAVHELARRGKTVELTFSVTNTGGKDSDTMVYWLNKDTPASDAGGITLIDTVNSKVHLVARDASKNCVCTAYGVSDTLPADSTQFFSATFGAPPENVKSMTVRLPYAGSLNDVPLS